MRKRIFQIIEVSDGYGSDRLSSLYDYIMIVVIVVSLIPLAFKGGNLAFSVIDKIAVVVFIIDYFLRWLTADYKFNKKSAASFLRYPFSAFAIIDLLSILPSLTIINSGFRVLRVLRMMRAMRVFRVFKTFRYSKSMSIIATVFRKQRSALTAVGTLAIGYIIVCALVIFNVEPESFNSFFDAIYWATVSLTTMGYGDIYPITEIGRTITMFSAIFGIAIVALPAGIITAGYMNEISDEKADDTKREEENVEKPSQPQTNG
ncbi:MAG: ion transporter [Lachnospiraceae bacterium]|nr:ion transporter [Lachnospiraceae bacterium]